MALLMSDQVIRIVLSRFAGQHASSRYLSVINVGDSRFFNTQKELDATIQEQQQYPAIQTADEKDVDFQKPQYSLSVAHTLSVASKLAYEDVAVVKYELEQAGFDVEGTFRPIGYKASNKYNVCAYIVEKENDVLLVFRGTNPLNIQNYVTNIDADLTAISSAREDMGRVHKGFWDAMGATTSSDNLLDTHRSSDIRVDINSTSLYQSITTAVLAIARIMKLLSFNIFANVIDPIDASWSGNDSSVVRHQSMYTQAEGLILKIFQDTAMEKGKTKKLYVTGHSLGGALATVFVAKMIQCDSPLIDYFSGLYTYGQPNIGDEDFGKSFGPEITCKIFNHTYNNDVVPRVPFWYNAPPGTLVFIDASYKISIYPPNPKTHEPIPVRPISFVHLSGLLNMSVIRRLRSETPTRILFRVLLPFFLSDHFPSDYSDALLNGTVEWVVMGEKEGGNADEENEKDSKRYSLAVAGEKNLSEI
ncbi:Alpha/Beta hydrolase protein [Mucor mucedo]|uniref:Alpha/Beta hydrolase protein n=1 Tax=Mucor mucedo TaxID=29922 RepID=UPI00222074E2|nr:Alpha/Beta hydrolase protein [Mucor mucedo]KAI7892633.1 Alpha/Beta hydrolase protein [Mucor mucedo]